jgi:C4-dicarboxylate-specific signal transduction histidine kinase
VIAWALSLIGGLTLRAKLYGSLIATGLLLLATLYARLRLASKRAKTAQEKAEKLEQTRELEQRIAASRAKTREQQEALRAKIRARSKERDYFER